MLLASFGSFTCSPGPNKNNAHRTQKTRADVKIEQVVFFKGGQTGRMLKERLSMSFRANKPNVSLISM